MTGPLRRPRRLAPGGVVGVAALSGPAREEDLAAGVAALEGFGYRVRLASNVHSREPLLGPGQRFAAKGASIVQVVDADKKAAKLIFSVSERVGERR